MLVCVLKLASYSSVAVCNASEASNTDQCDTLLRKWLLLLDVCFDITCNFADELGFTDRK